MAYTEINEAWIVGGLRTPIGRHGGSLGSVRPDDLGALVLEALVEKAGVPPEEVDDVYMGCANQAGEDNRNVARMWLLLAGSSGGDRRCYRQPPVRLGPRGGGERRASHHARGGAQTRTCLPHRPPEDVRHHAGLAFVNPKMKAMGHTESLGATAENLAEERFHVTAGEEAQPERLAGEYDISRDAQNRFALHSHEKAVAAMDEKRFRQEIVPVRVKRAARARRPWWRPMRLLGATHPWRG